MCNQLLKFTPREEQKMKHYFPDIHKGMLLSRLNWISIIFFMIVVLLSANPSIVRAEESVTLDLVSIDDILVEKVETGEDASSNHPVSTDIMGHWAQVSIQEMVQKGFISGYPDGTFQPDGNITRAEFVTILVKAFDMQPQAGKVFTDTQDHWAQNYIMTANGRGIVQGTSDSYFEPDKPLTREQMAIMIVSAANLSSSQNSLQFADQNQISIWALNEVATVAEAKIMSGYPDNTFRPQGQATRAEAVTAIMKCLAQS